MAEKVDRRVRKTKMQLRQGLARLMQKKSIKEITVKELVDEVDINRSTFYLHYTDIYQMLEKIEEEAMADIREAMEGCPDDCTEREKIIPFLARFFSIMDSNRDLSLALLGPNGDMDFVERIETLIANKFLKQSSFPTTDSEIRYAYAFCLSGCIGMIKTWLSRTEHESPDILRTLHLRRYVLQSLLRPMEKRTSPRPVLPHCTCQDWLYRLAYHQFECLSP